MKTVTVKIMGQPAQVLENFSGETIADVKSFLSLDGNYTFNMGGKPATSESLLSDGAYIVFAPSVKGAAVKKATRTAVKATKKTVKRAAVNPNKTVTKKTATKRK